MRKVAAGAVGIGAALLGVAAALRGRARHASKVNAELWSQATRGVAERDLTSPSTVAVDTGRRPND